MTAVPDLLHGAWARRSVSVSSGTPFETQHVVWLQAGIGYADIRVPFCAGAGARCFTGRSGWDGERYRWTHHLDLEEKDGVASPSADDIGDLRWEDGVLIERGDFASTGGPVAYEELWVRLPGACGPFVVQETPTASFVRVGDHAITVVDTRCDAGSFRAVYRTHGWSGWVVAASIGQLAEQLPGPDDVPGWPVIQSGTAEVLA